MQMSAIANDPNGVEAVWFYVDGVIEAVDFAEPYSKLWDATIGVHSLKVGGVDLCGNESESAPITVTIVEPNPCAGDTTGPTVSITEPQHNQKYEPGTVTVEVDASDPGGVDRVEIYIDGALVATDSTAPYTYFWGDGTIGWHTVRAKAFDGCGNDSWSFEISVELGPIGPDFPPFP